MTTWKVFVKAGRALFSVENFKTGKRFTFKVKKHRQKDVWFVYVLSGPDNYSNYSFVGVIDGEQFVCTPRSRITKDAPSWQAFNWLNDLLNSDKELPNYVKFWHAGRCGRCGRLLTVPESIETGFGPECSGRIGISPRHSLMDVEKIRQEIAKLEREIGQ